MCKWSYKKLTYGTLLILQLANTYGLDDSSVDQMKFFPCNEMKDNDIPYDGVKYIACKCVHCSLLDRVAAYVKGTADGGIYSALG